MHPELSKSVNFKGGIIREKDSMSYVMHNTSANGNADRLW